MSVGMLGITGAPTVAMDLFPTVLTSLTREAVPLHAPVNTNPAGEAQSPAAAEETPRRPASYKPSIWHDDFIQSLSIDWVEDEHMGKTEKVKQDVRGLLGDETLGLAKQLELVDVLQRLGVGRHFDGEIHSILVGASTAAAGDLSEALQGDLSSVAILFKLLRQHGYRVSQDIFNSFRGANGDFEACFRNDIRGALHMYEASQHAHKNESTLDAARAAAVERLKNLAGVLDPIQREEVAHALELPLNRRIARLETRWFLEMYARKPGMNSSLLELAEMDFNMVQSVHRRDLKKMSSWWRNLGLTQNLSFARDRIMENFFCSSGIVPEPQFSCCREKLTQVCSLITIIDDVYDEYGTYDELQLFTNAVERWDVNATMQLPQYMKACYLALLHTIDQMSHELQREKGLDVLPYLKKVWADLCRSFLMEAKWYRDKHMPTFVEYMCNAWISISVHVVLAHAFLFMNLDISKEDLEYIQKYPNLIRFSAIIFRLCNDLVEREGADTPSSIACYMNENNVAKEVASRHIKDIISGAWQCMNEETVAFSLPTAFIAAALNVSRTGHCLYQHGDGHGNPGLEFKNKVKSLFLEPVSVKKAASTDDILL